MLKDFTDWLVTVIATVFTSLFGFVQDAFIQVFDLVVTAFATLVAAIPAPQFLTDGLGKVFAQLDPSIMYFLSQAGIAPALAVIGVGYAFRILRKFVTLFQW